MGLTLIDPAQLKGGTGWSSVSTRYNFASQTPGGTLSVGSNTITLTPVPLGINGTNTLHYLRISGGTGTAEQVLITGGTAVSGAATGTVTVTCANTHSGAWTVQTATAGIQEAVWAAGSTGSVVMPSGSHTTYATFSIPSTYTKFSLHGVGAYATTILPQSTSTDVLYWNTAGFVGLYDFGITGVHGGSAGWGVKVLNATWGEIAGVYINSGYNGMYLSNPNSIHVSHVVGYGLDKIGLQVDANSLTQSAVSKFESLDFSTYGHLAGTNTDTAALYLTTQTGGTIAGPTFTDCQFLGFSAAVLAVAAAGTSLNEVTIVGGGITGHIYGVKVVATGATAYNWRLDAIQYIASLSSDVVLSGPAISIDEGVVRFSVSGSTIENAAPGFQTIDIMGSKLVNIIGNVVSQLGAAPEIQIRQGGSTNASQVRIIDNELGYTSAAVTTGSQAVAVSAHAHTSITIQGNRMYGSVAALSFAATGLGSYIQGNYTDPASGAPGKPTAAAAIRGSVWYTASAPGVVDLYEICRKAADNSYAWTTLL